MNPPQINGSSTALFAMLAAGLFPLLGGCGGGAATVTTVTHRPSHPEAAAPEATGAEAAAPEAGGAATAKAGGFGTLKGKVLYGGTYTPLAPLYTQGNAPKDNAVCGMETAPDQRLIVNDGGIANVFLWLDKPPKGVKPPDSTNEPVIFDQKFCVFKPHAMIMRTEETVKVLNSDPVLHNTHTKPERNNEFNQGIEGNTSAEFIYTRPEKKPLSVVCDIHPWMNAYHLPLDHPWAAVTAEDGTFEIPNLPSGKLQLKVWHEVGQELEKAYKVEIKPDETTTVEITVPASKVTP
jgi:hypothetical protein